MIVYIQCIDNIPAFDFAMACYEGALKMGMKIIKFEKIDEVPANKNNLVVACIEDTLIYLNKINGRVPEALNIFSLFDKDLLNRKHFTYTLQELFDYPDQIKNFMKVQEFFIKPLYETKAFASGVIKDLKNLPLILSDYKGSKNIEVLVTKTVDIVSEYRVFVRRNRPEKISGMKHYSGDFFVYPNKEFIIKCINHLTKYTDFPASYTLDIGILSNGETIIVELNDGWSCGNYGLDGETYLKFYLDRWKQLMGPEIVQPDHYQQ